MSASELTRQVPPDCAQVATTGRVGSSRSTRPGHPSYDAGYFPLRKLLGFLRQADCQVYGLIEAHPLSSRTIAVKLVVAKNLTKVLTIIFRGICSQ